MAPTRSGTLQIPEGNIFWRHEHAGDTAPNTRPTLVLLHAAVADNTLWDEQVTFLIERGWTCLRLDLLGFGQSQASTTYVQNKVSRKPVDHLRYIEMVIDHVVGSDKAVILIGLSRGGGFALDFAVTYPGRVLGLAVIAGGIDGFDHPSLPEEDELFQQEKDLLEKQDIEGVARVNVRIWGDGPSQKPGRASPRVAKQLYDWYLDIAGWECAGTGGSMLEHVSLVPYGIEQLGKLKSMPVAVAYGAFDETHTTAAMKHVGKELPQARVKGFAAGHMINLEKPEEFNEWLVDWLNINFRGNQSRS